MAVPCRQSRLPRVASLLLGIILFVPCGLCWKTYEGSQVLRITLSGSDNAGALQDFLRDTENLHLDVWNTDFTESGDLYVDVMVPDTSQRDISQYLDSNAFNYNVQINDVGDLIKKFSPQQTRHKRGAVDVTEKFLTLQEIYELLNALQLEYPEICQRINIGTSLEGEAVWVLKLGIGGEDRSKPAIFTDSGIHSREFISHSTLLFIIKEVLSGYQNKSEDVMDLLETVDLFFLPVINPDGYKICHTSDRLWRKNVRKFEGVDCTLPFKTGVDLNRNFDFHWNESGVSQNPCWSIYPGPEAFSEPETRNIVNFLSPLEGTLQAYVSYHSYSQKILYPYSYQEATYPVNIDEQRTVAEYVAGNMTQVYNTTYVAGSSPDIMYEFSGSSADWAAGRLHVPISIIIELRDKGQHGFVLPPELIIPTGTEAWAGWKVIAEHVMNKVKLQQELRSVFGTASALRDNNLAFLLAGILLTSFTFMLS